MWIQYLILFTVMVITYQKLVVQMDFLNLTQFPCIVFFPAIPVIYMLVVDGQV